jgi:galactokinase
MSIDLLNLAPVPTLLRRVREELSASFLLGKPIRVSRAPGRLDVMGGIADYTGSLVCEMPLDRAAAVALTPRDDRQVQAFSFNLFDEHVPFTITMSLDDLAKSSIAELRASFAAPGRTWGGYLLGCLAVLHEAKLIDLADPSLRGFNLALLSDVPLGAGVSSSAAIEVATMMNLVEHLDIRNRVDPMKVSAMCQRVENHVVGAPCGIMDQVASCAGLEGSLMRMVCQPHEIGEPLKFPVGIRAVGINSNVKHSVGGGQYGKTRCAAFMGHAVILEEMRRFGRETGRELIADPMRGYLANLDPEDYKRLFRPRVPEVMRGADFIAKYGSTIDTATQPEREIDYHVQFATDHHVLESRRVKEFARHLEEAGSRLATAAQRKLSLDKAGHLMYASHQSYTESALLGAAECDLLVALVRRNESAGLYGAKITGGGSGGTVAVLCEEGERASAMLRTIMAEYQTQTGNVPALFESSSPGGWAAGTRLVPSSGDPREG